MKTPWVPGATWNEISPRCHLHGTGDKQTRMFTQTPQIEAGRVLLPDQAPWLEDFRAEVLQFPHGRHDDQVDSLSQYLAWSRPPPMHDAPFLVFPSPFSVDWESEFGTSWY